MCWSRVTETHRDEDVASLVPPPFVIEPAGDMPPIWVVMRPVNDAALRAGLEFTVERNCIASTQ